MFVSRAPGRAVLALTAVAAAALASAGVAAPRSAGVEPAAADDLLPFALFDDYANGSLRTQGTWHVNNPGATDGAQAADDVPAEFSGKAMINRLDSTAPTQYRGNAYAELGELAIGAESSGTLFLEFVTADVAGTRLNLGLSADASPGLGFDTTGDPLDLDDYAVQLGADARGFVVRDGGQDRVVDNVELVAGELYAAWLVVDNAADTFRVQLARGDAAPVTASSGGQDEFAFRTGADAALVTFLHLNDPDQVPSANSYVDSIHVDPDSQTLDNPAPAFEEVTTFDDYTPGPLAGQGGWETSSPAAAVTADPDAEGNLVADVSGPNTWARRDAAPVTDGTTGTLFFRFQRIGQVDISLGLTDADAATTFADYEVQANNQRSATLNARDGAAFARAGQWAEDVWQCVWIVAANAPGNAADTYRMYSRGGPYQVTTRLPVDAATEFAFRNGTAEALDHVFLAGGGISPGQVLVDDVAVDADAANLRVPGGDEEDCVTVDSSELPLEDPIPAEPLDSGMRLTLEEYTTIPASGPGTPAARINYAGEIPDGSGRRYVPDLNGRMYVVDGGTPAVYLDVAAHFPDFVFAPSLGTGFGFVTFHPDFVENGLFYTVHTEAGGALTSQVPDLPYPASTSVHGVITEWHADDPAAATFSGTSREVLRIGFDTFLHGIQQIGFDPTAAAGGAEYGLLYVALGDGEEVPNFTSGPQDVAMPHGKILRIDPVGTDGAGGGYGVPPANPLVGDEGALGEIYAYGLRNPHRFSWDPVDGRMFVGMIGESNIDAIYDVHPGDNFGWNEREGAFLFKKTDPTNVYALPEDDAQYGYIYPVASYDHDTGNALVAGFVYRGDALPELRGKFVFGDIVSGRIFYTEAAQMVRGQAEAPIHEFRLLDAAGAEVTMRDLAGNARVDFRLGIDAAGELYVLSKANGKIWQVTGARQIGSCDAGGTVLTDVTAAEDWTPVTPSKWSFPGEEVVLAERGTDPGPPRRPYEYAVLGTGPEFGSVQVDAQVRIDEPIARNDRDVIVVFGYRSPTQFYYAHVSQDNASYPHNGIFLVNDADRLRLDDQWDGAVGAPPAITDEEYHQVRVRHCAQTGEIAVYVDDLAHPLMTATDTTIDSGRVGFGSFDNYGRLRELTVTGSPVGVDAAALCAGRLATIAGTNGPDVLRGTEAADVIVGLAGPDTVEAGGGDDYVCGGAGPDALRGGTGADHLYGGSGPDAVDGGSGDDALYGGAGPDALRGGAGTNTVDQDGPAN